MSERPRLLVLDLLETYARERDIDVRLERDHDRDVWECGLNTNGSLGPSSRDWANGPRGDHERARGPGASVAFRGGASSQASYAPDSTISTSQSLVVDPPDRLTISEFGRRYRAPLLSFTSFASDRPDGITQEAFLDADAREGIEVWRQGRVVQPREWRPVGGYLFHAKDLPAFEPAITRWWELHESVWPALDLFAEHVGYGNTYRPARLLTLHTALEGYARARHGHKNFRRLRDYAGVPNSVTGCTNDALSLLGASQKYFAHIGHTGQRHTVNDVQDGLLDSTRRASALMQACLLREVGFESVQTEHLLSDYYMAWPLT
jgi:hypothetical protein